MAEVLVRYTTHLPGNGDSWLPQACGRPAGDGLWEGWIEFLGISGRAVRTPRETEQPDRDALMYWAQGLTEAYLEGALERALDPHVVSPPPELAVQSVFAAPAERHHPSGPVVRPVLDPFATYFQGEDVLRRQLGALSRDHLVNIARGYAIDVGAPPESLTEPALVEGIVAEVRLRASG